MSGIVVESGWDLLNIWSQSIQPVTINRSTYAYEAPRTAVNAGKKGVALVLIPTYGHGLSPSLTKLLTTTMAGSYGNCVGVCVPVNIPYQYSVTPFDQGYIFTWCCVISLAGYNGVSNVVTVDENINSVGSYNLGGDFSGSVDPINGVPAGVQALVLSNVDFSTEPVSTLVTIDGCQYSNTSFVPNASINAKGFVVAQAILEITGGQVISLSGANNVQRPTGTGSGSHFQGAGAVGYENASGPYVAYARAVVGTGPIDRPGLGINGYVITFASLPDSTGTVYGKFVTGTVSKAGAVANIEGAHPRIWPVMPDSTARRP